MVTIERITARAIPDSRGIPTIEATLSLSDGSQGIASVPSGTSTGKNEAVELRDQDPAVAGGKGVTRALQNVTGEIQAAVKGQLADLPTVDRQLIELDGTPNKHRLGANAILAASCALARALSVSVNEPLYVYLRKVFGLSQPTRLPRPLVNVFEGGRHAATAVSVQEFHLIPEADSVREQVADVRRAYDVLGALLMEKQLHLATGMEGTYTAPLKSHQAVFELLQEALERSEVRAAFGIDAAASEFYQAKDQAYHLVPESLELTGEELCSVYQSWQRTFPIRLIEDPVDQEDWQGWSAAVRLLGPTTTLIGDDFLTTNPGRIRQAFARGIHTGVLLKPNQIGTISETVQACALAAKEGVPTVMSNRSGETLDSFIADFAVALSTDYLKAGGPYADVRAAKYDRLAAIAEELHA